MIIIDYIAKAIGVFTVIVVGWLAFVSMYPAYDTRRFRVTIDVHTPEGTKTDTSIIEYRRSPSYNMIRWLGGRGLIYLSTTAHGVAPVVNMGRHGWLVASLVYDRFSHTCKSLYESLDHPGRLGFVGLLSRAFNLPAGEDLAPLPSFASLRPLEWTDARHPPYYWLPASGDLDGASCARMAPRHLEYLTAEGVFIARIYFEPTTEPIQRRISSAKAPWVERIRRGEAKEPYWVSKTYGSFPAGIEVALPRPMRMELLER